MRTTQINTHLRTCLPLRELEGVPVEKHMGTAGVAQTMCLDHDITHGRRTDEYNFTGGEKKNNIKSMPIL